MFHLYIVFFYITDMAHGWTPIWLYQQVKIIYIITIIYKITYNYNNLQKLIIYLYLILF